MPRTIRIAPRFCGPPDLGNGGYVAGLLAGGMAAERTGVQVTLRAGTPLARDLEIEVDAGEGGESRLLRDGETRIAEATAAPLDFPVPDLPDEASAAGRAGSCRAFQTHPFPGCFVCGPDRAEGDGLRIFPGWHPEHDVAVAPWTPDGSLADESGRVHGEFLWAALDCTGSFALLEDEERGRALEPMVLGRLTVALADRPGAGESLQVAAWMTRQEGRRGWVRSALLRADGRVAGRSEAVWVSLAGRAHST